MGTAKPLVKEINHYLEYLSTEQRKVVLSVVKPAREEEAWADDKAAAARKAAATKGPRKRSQAAKKAARTRSDK